MAVRLFSSTALLQYRPVPNTEEEGSFFHVAPRRVFNSHRLNPIAPRSRLLKCNSDYFTRKFMRKSRTQAIAEYLGSASDPKKPSYHPSEEIRAYVPENPRDSRLPPAVTARTIIEVNKKGTLMLSGLLGIGLHENILWPDIPYVTDQHGNIYFQVKENEDIMQTLVTSDNNYVQVIVGFDTMEMIKDMELSTPSGIGFEIEEMEGGISEVEDENKRDKDEDEGEEDKDDEEWVAVLEDGDEDDDDYVSDSDESLGDWANLETMRNCHPMYFARRIAEVASKDPLNWMEQPSAGLAIQGLLSRVFVKDHSDISDPKSTSPDNNKEREKSGEKIEDSYESEIVELENSRNAISYYKLEMNKIQLITAQGHQTQVEVEDVRKAKPDAVALASDGIVSRLEEDGDKLTEALKSLCWRHNGIQAEVKKRSQVFRSMLP
ncbi:unnamed protein product [Eruca vesicaria subsp. sativa]|uniref:Uncharacterized protein n=1 Tax=Eruca vesicaria subsp. sativa TaxID=29727 RepID=A0ABC8K0J2_ERUVS|nr:unnamed protein product [Eruca vesicaria subsp. sativa]